VAPPALSLSLNEIIHRHQDSRRIEEGEPLNDHYTLVGKPNKYDSSDAGGERQMQVNVLDVIYNNRLCNLVLIRDITKLVSKKVISAANEDTNMRVTAGRAVENPF